MPSESIEIVEDLKEAQSNFVEAHEELKEAKEEFAEAKQELTKVKKKKTTLIKKSQSKQKKLSPVDQIHLKNDAVCFSKPVDRFSFYAIDTEGFRKGEYNQMISRGVMKFSNLEDVHELIQNNEKILFGFKPMQGGVLLQRYPKQWARLSMGARDMIRKGMV